MMSAMLEAAGPTDISLGTQEAMEHSRDHAGSFLQQQPPHAPELEPINNGGNVGTVGHGNKATKWHDHRRKMSWSSVVLNEV